MLARRSLFYLFWFFSFLTICALGLTLDGRAQDSNAQTPWLKLTIFAPKNKIHVGDNFELRYELSNLGESPLYVSTGAYEFTRLDIGFFSNGTKLPDNRRVFVSDSLNPCFGKNSQKYAQLPPAEFAKYWLELLQGHFYGEQIPVPAETFPQLKNPGKYTVKATYRSSGFPSKTHEHLTDAQFPISCYGDQLKRMPYPAWEGVIESNPLEIEVLPAEDKK